MLALRKSFNCCKTFGCENLGVIDSPEYTPLSYHLGYPALHCHRCGSYPPLVDDATIHQLVQEKSNQHFSLTPCGCPNCLPMISDHRALGTRRYGRTGAGQQRLACRRCSKVFTAPRWPATEQTAELLARVFEGKAPMQTMATLALAPKLYYEQLQRLANGLRFLSRQLEAARQPESLTGLLTESQTLEFSGHKRVWILGSSHAHSGYMFLINHNLAHSEVSSEGRYQSTSDSRLSPFEHQDRLGALKLRYEQTLKRPHFEDLNYGPAQPLRGAALVKPALLAYAHFQMLQPLTDPSAHIHHYLEHESCIRGAALMGSIDAIRAGEAEVFYTFRHETRSESLPTTGHKVGWWHDRWYPAHFGAYSPITYRSHYRHPMSLANPSSCDAFWSQLNGALPYQLRSTATLDAWLEIQRCYFNFMHCDETSTTAAMRLGLTQQVCQPHDLVEMAQKAIETFYA
jgi:hypothetical protein